MLVDWAVMRTLPLLALLTACGAEKFPMSDHCDGKTFYNNPPLKISPWSVLKWQFTRQRNPWPDSVEVKVSHPGLSVASGIKATWVGHATVLVQTPGSNLLTDPVWSRRVGPWSWTGPSRFAKPGVEFDDLPRIDAVLVSHDHYDHLDMPTLERLARERSRLAIAPLGTAELLKKAGFEKVVALDWWESTALPSGDTVTLVPATHHSIRWPWDKNTRLWGGYVVSTRAGRVYFAGDTGDGPHFEEIGKRFGPIELALIPIGSYLPRWFMRHQHIGPDEAVSAAKRLGAKTSMAIHWGVFRLADDGYREAPDTLESLLRKDSLAPDFRVVEVGGAVELPGITWAKTSEFQPEQVLAR
jgi:L-ascorbate metabolism protein UlaG (beta-lactamase superfamily)